MKQTLVTIAIILLVGGVMYYYQSKLQEPVPEEPVVEIEYQQVTYQGNGFSFEHPDKYARSPEGLWTKDRYFYYRNPRLDTPSDLVSDINIYVQITDGTMDEYFTILYEIDKIEYEEIVLGDYAFNKFTHVFNEYTIVHYATQQEDAIYIFRVFAEENDNQELLDIISTLQINQE